MNKYLFAIAILLSLAAGFATVEANSYLMTNCKEIVKQAEGDSSKMSPLAGICYFGYIRSVTP